MLGPVGTQLERRWDAIRTRLEREISFQYRWNELVTAQSLWILAKIFWTF